MILVFLSSEIPCFQPTEEQVRRFAEALPECADVPVRLCRTEAEFTALLPQATAVFVWTFRQEWFSLAPRLRHVCTPAAGRDYFRVVPPEGVTMHYGSFHGAIMGETALGALLAVCHGLLPFAGEMSGGRRPDAEWPRIAMARHGRRLGGSRVTILGYGNIGRQFARMLAPFGARVTGVTRRPHPELAEEAARLGVALATADRLDALLPETDHLVCFLPSGDATKNLLDARRLALLPPSAVLYNFGRGNLIDEDALADALAAGRLGGAVLDVFQTEPLPATSPLRRSPNCWLYPHASAFAPDYLDLYFAKCARAMREFAEAKAAPQPPPPPVAIPYGDAPLQTGDLYLPAGGVTAETPKLLVLHGGGWRSEKLLRDSFRDTSELFRAAGYAVYNVDYRLAPAAPWPDIGDDCLAAARKLVSCDGMPQLAAAAGRPIALLGASAGGHLALMTGLRLPPRDVLGIVSVSGIADPDPDVAAHPDRYTALFAGGPLDPAAFPAAHLAPDAPPVLLTHCWHDTVVPIESAIAFARAMTDRGLRAETYFYDLDRANQGHAIWDLENKAGHVFYPDLQERCLAFLRDVRGLPQPLPGGAAFPFLGKLRDIPSADVRESGVSIGFECLDRDLFDPEPCYDRLAAIGVKHARVQTGWWKCEKEKGVYDWTWLDGIVGNLERRGIEVWFNVGFGNKLYMGDTYGEASVGFVPIHYGAECETAWRNFCRALAEHYRGRVSRFEIWNEVNGRGFWRPKDPDPDGYARLVEITAGAIREAQPDARCGGCLAGYPKTFLLALKRNGALANLDFFSLHPYDPHPEQAWPANIAWIRELFRGAGRGGRDIAIWQGESGFASWTPEKYWQPRFVRESERAQAVWLLRRYVLDFSLGLELSSYFQAADMMKKGYQMGENEQAARKVARQGVLNGLVYTPKPAYRALASIAAVFRDGVRPVDGQRFLAWQDDARPKTERHARLENAAVRCLAFARGRTPYYVYYMPADPQYGWADAVARTTLEIFRYDDLDELREPVLVNLLTGDVFALGLRGDSATQGAVYLDNLPLCDAPMLVCDRVSFLA